MLAEHGTSRRHYQHLAIGENPCGPCVEAFRAARRRRTTVSRIRTGKDNAMRVPLEVLAAVLAGDADALATWMGPDVADAVTERVVSRTERAA